MGSVVASRLIGLARVKYIAWLLGRSAAADAFNAAFQVPDLIAYFLAGGAASISFVTILTRYRETGREAEAQRTLCVILTTMVLVMGGAIVLAEFLAPQLIRIWFSGFPADKAALCAQLTRIMLPSPLFFFAGGIFGAVLLSRRIFSVQAFASPFYSLSILLGGVLLYHFVGVASLAIGAVAGAFIGTFLLNVFASYRLGTRYRPILDWSDPGFREWLGMSIPLMLGVTLTQTDTWIIAHFASHEPGAVTMLTYAKQLFRAPMSLGQAAGAASLPFMAALFSKGNLKAFAEKTNSSVTRVVAFSFLLSAFLIAMALPLADVLIRGGAFHRNDSGFTAIYFAIFAISLCAWSAMPLYNRTFYAMGDTMTPMIWGTVVTVASLPVYWSLYRAFGPTGLAIASDVGVFAQTITFAYLLHRRRVVSMAGLGYGEMAKALLASAIALFVLVGLYRFVHTTSRLREVGVMVVATLIWFGICLGVLRLTRSSLPDQLTQRFFKRA